MSVELSPACLVTSPNRLTMDAWGSVGCVDVLPPDGCFSELKVTGSGTGDAAGPGDA